VTKQTINLDDLICQESCANCGDNDRHRITHDDLKWTRRGDALCSECGNMRDATSATVCCLTDDVLSDPEYRKRNAPPTVAPLTNDEELSENDRAIIRAEAWALHDDYMANPDTTKADELLAAIRASVSDRRMRHRRREARGAGRHHR
jgi:hypothetical protein